MPRTFAAGTATLLYWLGATPIAIGLAIGSCVCLDGLSDSLERSGSLFLSLVAKLNSAFLPFFVPVPSDPDLSG